MKEIYYKDYYDIVLKNIAKGAFLTLANGNKKNTMTIGWGSLGYIWGKPIFMIMVRKSRYSYQLLENNKKFTVCLPADNQLKKELLFCGSNSGRNVDKFKECSLTPVKGKMIDIPVIGEAMLHFECKVVYKQDMDEFNLEPEYNRKWYSDKDYHTIYYGEILCSYINK